MRLLKVVAKNYKGYKNLELNLNQINVLIGKNGSGKSTIARLIPLVISSLYRKNSGPLDFFPLGIDIASQFSDLSYGKRESSTVMLGAGFEHKNCTFSFATSVIFSTELKRILVSAFNLVVDGQKVLDLELNIAALTSSEPKTLYKDLLKDNELNVVFNGLLPDWDFDRQDGTLEDKARSFFNHVASLADNISYLGPFRRVLRRVYPYKMDLNLAVGPEGEYAPYIFCNQDQLLGGALSHRLKEWMESNFDGKYITVNKSDVGFSLNVKKEAIENNIIDDGVGFSQVFPLLVDRLSRIDRRETSIEIVEQPELHLHPAACGVIADLYLTALSNHENTVILETHSQELLLRIRRRVAEGQNANIKNAVNIIYTSADNDECKVEYINIDANGALDWWPKGVFEESFDEVIAISEAKSEAKSAN